MNKTEVVRRESSPASRVLAIGEKLEKERVSPRAQAEIFELIEREERRLLSELSLKLNTLAGLPRWLEETNARLEQLEQQVLDVQLEAGRFSTQTGPMLLAVKTLKEEIAGGAEGIRAEIEEHRARMIELMSNFATETKNYHRGVAQSFNEMTGLLRAEAADLKSTLQVPAHLSVEGRRVLSETSKVLERLPGRIDTAGERWNKALLTVSRKVGAELTSHSLEVVTTHKAVSAKLHLTVPLAVALTIVLITVPSLILLRWGISRDVSDLLKRQREVNTEIRLEAPRRR